MELDKAAEAAADAGMQGVAGKDETERTTKAIGETMSAVVEDEQDTDDGVVKVAPPGPDAAAMKRRYREILMEEGATASMKNEPPTPVASEEAHVTHEEIAITKEASISPQPMNPPVKVRSKEGGGVLTGPTSELATMQNLSSETHESERAGTATPNTPDAMAALRENVGVREYGKVHAAEFAIRKDPHGNDVGQLFHSSDDGDGVAQKNDEDVATPPPRAGPVAPPAPTPTRRQISLGLVKPEIQKSRAAIRSGVVLNGAHSSRPLVRGVSPSASPKSNGDASSPSSPKGSPNRASELSHFAAPQSPATPAHVPSSLVEEKEERPMLGAPQVRQIESSTMAASKPMVPPARIATPPPVLPPMVASAYAALAISPEPTTASRGATAPMVSPLRRVSIDLPISISSLSSPRAAAPSSSSLLVFQDSLSTESMDGNAAPERADRETDTFQLSDDTPVEAAMIDSILIDKSDEDIVPVASTSKKSARSPISANEWGLIENENSDHVSSPGSTGNTTVSGVLIADALGERGIYSGEVTPGTQIPNGFGMMMYSSGLRCYKGGWVAGHWEGAGQIGNAIGDVYDGSVRKDKKDGEGVLKFSDGRIFEGEFKNDRMYQGRLSFPDGSKYEGPLKNGKRNGFGINVFADGSRYEGEWKNNSFEGKGNMVWSDGGSYDGDWHVNLMHGSGVEILANGTIRHDGRVENGSPLR